MNFSLPKIAGWLFTAAGVITLFCSMTAWFHARAFLRSASKADGFIIRLVDGYSASIHYPVYGFRKPDGRWQEVFTDTVGKHPTKAQSGDKVALLYPPDHPADAMPYTFWNVWAVPVKRCITGVIVLLFGLGALFVAREQ